jgi:hypothetical protein
VRPGNVATISTAANPTCVHATRETALAGADEESAACSTSLTGKRYGSSDMQPSDLSAIRRIRHCLCSAAVAIACIAFLSACGERYWERTLSGPFTGDPYEGRISTPPSNSLALSKSSVLDVHWEPGISNPIIRLRNADGTFAWARLLAPRFEGQHREDVRISELTLRNVKPSEDGFKVRVSCDWNAGGKEGGIIYLNKDYTFRSFALGW